MEKVKVEQHSGAGGLWLIGWIFTIGFVDLSFWKGLIALIVWPYFIGDALRDQVFAPPVADAELVAPAIPATE